MEAEWLLFTDQTPMVATNDMRRAEAFANLVASTAKSAAAFLDYARCEAAEILAAHKSAVAAIADALIEHGTLNAEQIDDCIAIGEAEGALQVEKARRKQWADTVARAKAFRGAYS
jgi:ATP-dependent Zn protease